MSAVPGIGHTQLRCDMNNLDRHDGHVRQERSEIAHRQKLQGVTETIVIATPFRHHFSISVVQEKEPIQHLPVQQSRPVTAIARKLLSRQKAGRSHDQLYLPEALAPDFR